MSAVPDEQSGEVGGLQNTGTQLGASIGTALAGAVLISALTASFLTGIQNNPAVPDRVVDQAQTSLAGGVPFISDADLEAALDGRARRPADGQRDRRRRTRRAGSTGCASPCAILALFALLALPFTRGIPTVQPGAESLRLAADIAIGGPETVIDLATTEWGCPHLETPACRSDAHLA